MPVYVAALITCHNRRENTLACLRTLKEQLLPRPELGGSQGAEGRDVKSENKRQKAETYSDLRSPTSDPTLSAISINVFLVDDGSTDGTADAVRVVWPEATILQGDGSLFWCGGMRAAWAEAAKTDPDYYFLLNDDTLLMPNALANMLVLSSSPSTRTISIGAICDPVSGEWTYGGGDCEQPYNPQCKTPRLCKTINGNCVLISRTVYQEIGMFNKTYTHLMGDHDYGFEATRRGIPILETPQFVGKCQRNTAKGTWRDPLLSRTERWRHIFSPKGLPPREWFAYCYRNLGWKWPIYFVSPYIKTLFRK